MTTSLETQSPSSEYRNNPVGVELNARTRVVNQSMRSRNNDFASSRAACAPAERGSAHLGKGPGQCTKSGAISGVPSMGAWRPCDVCLMLFALALELGLSEDKYEGMSECPRG
jgi:hypothetical protein